MIKMDFRHYSGRPEKCKCGNHDTAHVAPSEGSTRPTIPDKTKTFISRRGAEIAENVKTGKSRCYVKVHSASPRLSAKHYLSFCEGYPGIEIHIRLCYRTPMNDLLKQLPSVDDLLKDEVVKAALAEYPRALVLEALRAAVDAKRKELLKQKPDAASVISLSVAGIRDRALAILKSLSRPSLRPVINATGVVIHTNLGRSLLSEKAIERVVEVGRGYSNLEYDIEAGERGKRFSHIEGLLKRLTGTEAATAVNNNAAAVLLCLNTLARGKEVIVSRGELVEIGGSFRVPEVMERSGAILREVGATNKTHLKDYEKAINENTGLLLKVHASNYKIVGFTKEVSAEELAKLGKKRGIPVMWDLGSGSFVKLGEDGTAAEPTVQQAIDAGVDVLTFSGDKLLGGPQAGLILGAKACLDSIRANPLSRALRIDKLTLAALEATLAEYFDPEKARRTIPTLWMLTQPLAEIERKAELLAALITKGKSADISVSIENDRSQSGGGALPLGNFPTRVVTLRYANLSANAVETRLRLGEPHIIARIKDGMVVFDPRTLNDAEIAKIAAAVLSLT
jgi:L-seryl-tRNA(Ser) seleniumtransferase